CNPNNPTGIVYGRDELQQVGDMLRENRHVLLILDECYSRILYDEVKYCNLFEDKSLRDQILIVNSFSKTYAMTGWRLGYVIANQSYIDRIASVAFDIRSSTNTAVQYAGAVALGSDAGDLELMVNEYRARRNLMMDYLKGMGLSFPIPQGGFEIFANFSEYGMNSSILKTKLAQDVRVETVAGSEFGPHGEGYLRLVFCVDRDKLIEGMERIRFFLEDGKNRSK
ncbi:MAG: pyridoxal phosphate-dependent aminotransferase, partial [Thaumarchaeota archaeon]|nr:pyridoxal phosphate-dependent aminotransferase [Nitrososphaerota archaeon]